MSRSRHLSTKVALGAAMGVLAAGLTVPSGAGLAPGAATAAVADATATAISPNAWYIDQTERRFFTVKLNRTVCDGGVDVTIYGRGGKLVDWWYQSINRCTSSVTFDRNMYDWLATGVTGAGSAKIEVSDYSNGWTSTTRSLPFYLKTAATQTISGTRKGQYVTMSGYTRRYDLAKGFDARWVAAATTPVQYQKLVGSTWKTMATTKTDRNGRSTMRLYAPTKSTFRVLYPGSITQAGAASAKLVK